MKFLFKTILKYYLKYITKLVLAIHRPTIIAISGSSNKTFIREEIKKILTEQGKTVRANPKNFNTEIGLPLAILNIKSGYNSYRAWLPVILSAFLSIFQKNFPHYLVLELGVSKKNDMRYLLSIVSPKISIISEITQRYLESFSGMDSMVREYKYLVSHTNKNGLVILSYDNARVRNLAKKAKARVEYFGLINNQMGWKIEDIVKTEKGQKFTLDHNGKKEMVFVNRFGEHHCYAFTVGKILKNLLANTKNKED